MSLLDDCGFYLLTPDGKQHEPGDNPEDMAIRANVLLFDYEWVEMRKLLHEERTRLTVMQRNSSGCPEIVTAERWDEELCVWNLTVYDSKRLP